MLGALLVVLLAAACAVEEFTIFTEPISLLPGQVHNHPVKPVRLPQWVVEKYHGKQMGVVRFDLDIVAKYDGEEVRVPLSHVYNHHTIQAMGRDDTMQQLYKSWSQADPLGPPPQGTSLQLHDMHMPHCGSALTKPILEGDRFLPRLASHGAPANQIWVGTIGGAEYRNAERDMPAPYRQVVDSPESFIAIAHFINIKDGPYSPKDWPRLFECPCTSARKINIANGTIDGNKPLPFGCTAELLSQRNEDCKLDWYKGGYRCCEHHDFVTEQDPTHGSNPLTVFAKFSFKIVDVTPDVRVVQQGSFDVTGHNAEYAIPACDPSQGTEPRSSCVHIADRRVKIAEALGLSKQALSQCPNGYMQLITARGHQHVAGLGMELYDDRTGQLICQSKPVVGTVPDEAGNEKGFISGIPPCVWGPGFRNPPALPFTSSVTMVSRYNSSEAHHGVMGFWFYQAHIDCNRTGKPSLLV